jgi:hypothetical protein
MLKTLIGDESARNCTKLFLEMQQIFPKKQHSSQFVAETQHISMEWALLERGGKIRDEG